MRLARGASTAPKLESTASNVAAGYGSSCTSARSQFARGTRSRPRQTIGRDRSQASTVAPAATAHAGTLPSPAAAARTLSPCPTPDGLDELERHRLQRALPGVVAVGVGPARDDAVGGGLVVHRGLRLAGQEPEREQATTRDAHEGRSYGVHTLLDLHEPGESWTFDQTTDAVTPTPGGIPGRSLDSFPGMAPDGIAPHALADIDQEVVVTFRYPVRFTRGLFDPANPVLRDVVQAEGRARLFVVIDEGVADAHPEHGGRRAALLRRPLRRAAPAGAAAGRPRRRGDQERARPRQPDPRGDRRPRRRPPLLRGGDRRRRGARRRRLRGRHRPPRRAADPRPDHGPVAGRLGGRRQERDQRVRQEELRRVVRAAARGPERLRPAADPARPRLARRDLGGREGRPAQGRAVLHLDRAERRRRSTTARWARWPRWSTAAPSCT